jgi:hypothetical protein
MNIIRSKLSILAAALVLGMSACGGGGSDAGGRSVSVPTGARAGAASAGSDVSAANASSFAGPLARVMLGAADGNTPGLSSQRESPQAVTAASRAGAGLTGFAARQAARALRSPREQAQAVTTQTLACPFGGSITITVNDADNNNKLSTGDSVSMQLNACVAEQGLPAASGSLGFTINAVELDAAEEPTALDATMTLSGFAESGFGTLSGSFRVWFKEEGTTGTRQRVSYQNATVLEGAQTLRYDFDIYGLDSATNGSFDLNGAITIAGQAYALTSDVFSHAVGTLPASGTIRLRDAAGDTLILRARSTTTFDLEFQAAGAATPTLIAAGLAWNSFRLSS